MSAQPTTIIVDDNPGIRNSLESLLRSVGDQKCITAKYAKDESSFLPNLARMVDKLNYTGEKSQSC